MRCRLIVPVSLLTWVVCFGGINASAFERFRLMGEEAVVADPAPLDTGDEQWKTGQKSFQKSGSACQKDSVQKDCGPAQKGKDSFALPCRPHWRALSKTSCETACGPAQKGGAIQKDCGPVQKDCGPTQKGREPFAFSHCRPRAFGKACEPACGPAQKGAVQKDCGPAQKGCESFGAPCRPRFGNWSKACCEPACGPAQKGECAVQKDCGPTQKDCGPTQKGREPLALSCRPRLGGWSKTGCDSVVQKGGCGGAEQKTCDIGKGPAQKAVQK